MVDDETPGHPGPKAAPDKAPADRKKSHKAGSSKRERVRQSLLVYHGAVANLVAVSGNSPDAIIIATKGADATEAWMVGYDSDPRVRRVLEAITVSGPFYIPLVMAYGSMAIALMSNHGFNPLMLFQRVPTADMTGDTVPAGMSAPDTEPPYSGPPTTALGMAIPDEGLPADLEHGIRELAKRTGRPYDELRHEALVQLAQQQIARNGHQPAPAALGALVQE